VASVQVIDERAFSFLKINERQRKDRSSAVDIVRARRRNPIASSQVLMEAQYGKGGSWFV